MRVMLMKNREKLALRNIDAVPDYIVLQRQRLNDGTTGYQTVEVGYGYRYEAPDGMPYIDITLEGFGTNNRPNKTNHE